MRKVPTIFQRVYSPAARLTDVVTPGCEWVLAGEGRATRKYDGTCVLIRRDGAAVHAYTRREVKPGKQPPANFVEVGRDDITGKAVGWEPAAQSGFATQVAQALHGSLAPGTYELCGPKINGNPERRDLHVLIRHADAEVIEGVTLTFEGIRDAVRRLAQEDGCEGLVFHHPDGRMGKIKSRDYYGL